MKQVIRRYTDEEILLKNIIANNVKYLLKVMSMILKNYYSEITTISKKYQATSGLKFFKSTTL